jgi:hypothetical protein
VDGAGGGGVGRDLPGLSAETEPSGRFPEDNIRYLGLLDPEQRAWAPEPGVVVWAGDYWWQVLTKRRGALVADIYSAPSAFTVPARARIKNGWAVYRNAAPPSLEIGLSWEANVQRASITAKVFRRGRQLWSRRKTDTNDEEMDRDTGFRWPKPRLPITAASVTRSNWPTRPRFRKP